jgi:hypothetical protein
MSNGTIASVKLERRILPLAAFTALFCIGIAILAVAEWQHAEIEKEMVSNARVNNRVNNSDWRGISLSILQHLASALIVASVMGVSYEYFVHKHVVKSFGKLLEDHRAATEQAFDAFRSTTARDVFEFIGNIASHSARVPTLFRPSRDTINEILFSTDIKFFQRLIGSANARTEAIEVLGNWLESPEVQKRFLASDFVGLLLLRELEPRLRELATEYQKSWKVLSDADKGCVLNYWWAASRLENPMYETLKEYLVKWDDTFVQNWILFVPRQMPDARLVHMVELFLRTRGTEVSRDVVGAVVAAIEAFHHSGLDMKHTVTRYRGVFEKASLWQEACAAVSVALPPNFQPRSGRIVRVLRRFRKGPAGE